MKELYDYYARAERVYVYYYDKDEAQEWGTRTFEFPDYHSIMIEQLGELITSLSKALLCLLLMMFLISSNGNGIL